MRRRQLLTAIGGTASFAAVGSVGGAMGTAAAAGKGSRASAHGPDFGLEDEQEPASGVFPEGTDPFIRVSLGTRDGVDFPDNGIQRVVRIWNDSDQARKIGYRVRDAGRLRLWQIRTFPAGGWLELTLNQPSDYVVAVDVEGESTGDVYVGDFDCNTSTTTVRIDSAGVVSSTTDTTLLSCPGAELVEHTLSAESGRCGTLEEAFVSRENEDVVVDGSVLTPNPCYAARVESVEVDDDTLNVTIGASRVTDAACVQCIGHVPYQSRMRFKNAYPKRVTVDHHVNGRRIRMFDEELV
ncbi:hypothetical protein [Haloarchaeobius sp. TZWWS8]|uniref:hypothetical protein n=1 Tax=Haloarchaeobius sp. TZWWS8 TaxID=3446121 RepID=UPI003EBD5404